MPFKSSGAVSYSPSIVTVAVSVAVCEIFSVKDNVTSKTSLGFAQGHWKWHQFAFRSNYGIILYRLRDIVRYLSKIAKLLYNTLFSAPEMGDSVGILRRCLICIKLE